MRQDGWVVCAFDAVALVRGKDCWVCFEVVGGEDGVVGRGGAVADTVEDFGGHEGAVEEGGAAVGVGRHFGWFGFVCHAFVVVGGF